MDNNNFLMTRYKIKFGILLIVQTSHKKIKKYINGNIFDQIIISYYCKDYE